LKNLVSCVVQTLSRYRKNELSFVGDCSASRASAANDSSVIVSPSEGFAIRHTFGSFQLSSAAQSGGAA
jgi:hypothetical protein